MPTAFPKVPDEVTGVFMKTARHSRVMPLPTATRGPARFARFYVNM